MISIRQNVGERRPLSLVPVSGGLGYCEAGRGISAVFEEHAVGLLGPDLDPVWEVRFPAGAVVSVAGGFEMPVAETFAAPIDESTLLVSGGFTRMIIELETGSILEEWKAPGACLAQSVHISDALVGEISLDGRSYVSRQSLQTLSDPGRIAIVEGLVRIEGPVAQGSQSPVNGSAMERS